MEAAVTRKSTTRIMMRTRIMMKIMTKRDLLPGMRNMMRMKTTMRIMMRTRMKKKIIIVLIPDTRRRKTRMRKNMAVNAMAVADKTMIAMSPDGAVQAGAHPAVDHRVAARPAEDRPAVVRLAVITVTAVDLLPWTGSRCAV